MSYVCCLLDSKHASKAYSFNKTCAKPNSICQIVLLLSVYRVRSCMLGYSF
jgi:hypothetical protein